MTANFFYRHTATGENLYFVQREPLPGTQHVDRATASLVAFDPVDWDDYGQNFTEGPDYFYGATHLTISNSPYIYDIFKRAGETRAITDELVASIQGYWSGGTVHSQIPLSPLGYYQTDVQSVLTGHLIQSTILKRPHRQHFKFYQQSNMDHPM